ncbi:MAG: alpha/beta fold hydrolase [Anaerolineales bacterium]|jgi:pimeloyl-ACP methyl ester carboxylesterase
METLFFDRPEGKLAYDDNGTGPLVVCAPGMGDLRGEYRFLKDQLVSAGFRVITMDLRGHGESSVPWPDYTIANQGHDLVALIRSLNAGPAVVIGNSMSAATAIWTAAEAPELVDRLVLIGPAVRGDGTTANHLMYKALFARPWGPAMWLWYFNTLYPTHKPDDFEAYRALLRTNLSQPGRMEALKAMMLEPKTPAETRMPEVTAPVLAVMGTQDPDFKDPEAEARWVADTLKGRYQMIAGAGHYPHAELPEVTGPTILAFLQNLKEKQVPVYAA